MNLSAVDLNLLVAFEALFETRNVSQAAERVGLAQPSMSNALSRLRVLFDDELFVRTPAGMQPTARAQDVAPPIRDALNQVRAALAPRAAFDPATAEMQFRIGVTDYTDFAVIPRLATFIREHAPGVDLQLRAATATNAVAMIDSGDIDFMIGIVPSLSQSLFAGDTTPQLPKRIQSAPLFQERFVCVARKSHPDLNGQLTLDAYIGLSHLLVSPTGSPGVVDQALARIKKRRRVAVTIPHFLVVPFMVEKSDLVATIAERIAKRFSLTANIQIRELPIALPPWRLRLYWGRGADTNPATVWLREAITTVCAGV